VVEFFDPSDDIAVYKGLYIEFFHVPSGKSAIFKAFLTGFEDSFETTWASEDVYGRMDPIQTYQGTKRSLNLSWTVPAATVKEARSNMAEISRFIRMQYPVYRDVSNQNSEFSAHAISAPPLFKVKFANLVQSAQSFVGGASDVDEPIVRQAAIAVDRLSEAVDVTFPKEGEPAAGAENAGLLGTLSGFSFTPVIDDGFFDVGFGKLYPKNIECSCQMVVLHQHPLGFNEDGGFRQINFPYGFWDEGDIDQEALEFLQSTGQLAADQEEKDTKEQTAEEMASAQTKGILGS
tara:strand:+ start:92 stop:964 length:873 start_codon:yes stop_codon:yes gene_type:complete